VKTVKKFNGGDWTHRGGNLYVGAYSIQDACDQVNEAYRKLKGYVDRPDILALTPGVLRTYWCQGCWGSAMDGIPLERGVWWAQKAQGMTTEKPEKIG